MQQLTAKNILDIRRNICIPLDGFQTYQEALDWHKKHFRIHKGRVFEYQLGYKFDYTGRSLEYDFIQNTKGISFSAIPELDNDVPLDKSIADLIESSDIEEWKGPAMRAIVLMGQSISSGGIPPIPEWLSVEISGFRLLLSMNDLKSLREWRKLGERSGFLKSGEEKKETSGSLIIGYGSSRRWGVKEKQYWDVFCAYRDVLDDRIEAKLEGKPQKGKRGLNIEIGDKLIEIYKWNKYDIDSYTISRYLKRAKTRWYASILENYKQGKKQLLNKMLKNA